MDLAEELKKTVIAGLGVIGVSQKKAKQIVTQLEKQGEISLAEGKKLAKKLRTEIRTESEKQGKVLKQMVHKELDKRLKQLGVATKKDLEKLKKELKRKK